ncbi:hypothetical protein Tco_1276942 [Tanacetum coccineum]
MNLLTKSSRPSAAFVFSSRWMVKWFDDVDGSCIDDFLASPVADGGLGDVSIKTMVALVVGDGGGGGDQR